MCKIGFRLLLLVLLPGATAMLLSGSPLLVLNPVSGGLSGPPGSTVGWGFTINNDSDYIEITSAQFCLNFVSLAQGCTPPTLGTFTDFISGFQDIILGPPGAMDDPSSAMQNFDALAHTGIGSFQIDSGATVGNTDSGQLVLTYTVTDLDPRDPNAQVLQTDVVLSANASVTATATPEPATAGLLAAALAALGLRRRVAALAVRPV